MTGRPVIRGASIRALAGTATRALIPALLAGLLAAPLHAQTARLILNEVNAGLAGGRDLVELLVIDPGNTGGIMLQRRVAIPTLLATLPSIDVSAGDVVLVHLNTMLQEGDAPASETTGVAQFPAALYPTNYDAAWDVIGDTIGIPMGNGVIILRDPDSTIRDAVPFTDTGSTVAAFITDLQSIQSLGIWRPPDCGGLPCDYTTSPAAPDVSVSWTGTGITPFGPSVRRIAAADADTNADWSVGVSTWGALNQGQVVPVGPARWRPGAYALHQNYPNPFNPSTTIRFELQREDFVTLTVADILGRTVATLAEGRRSPGGHRLTFDASGLPGGVYFYRLRTGEGSFTGKMLLSR